MNVAPYSPDLAIACDNFLLENPQSLFYASSKYRGFLVELIGCRDETLVAIEGGSIKGILPLMHMAGEWGSVYNSLPYFGSNGGILAASDAASEGLARAYNGIAARQSTLASTIVESPFHVQEAIGISHNYSDHRIGQFTELQGGDQDSDLFARIASSARRNIRKAMREGVTIEVDHGQFGRVRQLHQANMQAIGVPPKSDAFFSLVPRWFTAGEDYDLFVAKRAGATIAALLVFYFNRTVEYFTPGIDEQYRTLQPLALIVFEAMKQAAQRGFQWWNWGGTGTTQSGVYRFKAKWAANARTYRYFTQVNCPTLLRRSPEELLKRYPNFYVVPFSALLSDTING